MTDRKPERIRRDIIDNDTDGITMETVLNSEIPYSKHLDISTGYFSVGGYRLLRTSLEKAAKGDEFSLRLLLGREAVVPDGSDTPGDSDRSTVGDGLDVVGLNTGSRTATSSLIRLLERANVLVKSSSKRFNHSKCYIIDNGSAYIGSSNLTCGGLTQNHELNAGLYQLNTVCDARRWFDRMWDEADDCKTGLILTLRQSKFGDPQRPFETYMKILFERFRPLLSKAAVPEDTRTTLTRFQTQAVRMSMFILSELGGVIIADSTGLGKTNIGIEIIRQKILQDGRKVLLVAPAQVLHTMWAEKLREVDIHVRDMITMESLGREGADENFGRYRNIDLVLVDESHNFRSKTANRLKNLQRLMVAGKKKQAVLLTATPINNSLMDLYYQLSIITCKDDAYFADTVGIPDLYTHMRKAANRDNLGQGLEKIQRLLDSVMVRRTRSYIREAFPDDRIGSKAVKFPRHEYRPIRYRMGQPHGSIFKKVVDGIDSLTMAPYGIGQYDRDLSDEEKSKHKALAHLQRILLLKRFESSIEAIKASLKNKLDMYAQVRSILEGGEILRVRDFNKILSQWGATYSDGDVARDQDEREDFFVKKIAELEKEKAGQNYDVERLKHDMDHDISVLENLYGEVCEIRLDTKLDSVVETMLSDRILDKEGKKALIFTEYKTTAKYVTRKLKKRFPKKVVECITGSTDQDTRKQYIRRFAPKANVPEGEALGGTEIDVLVSTEVLAEGQNLQDCNYVINYDLPWNPMRIVQRTGRIDRLTSPHEVIHSRACYPANELEDLLKLMGTLLDKIRVADAIVGGDEMILGEEMTAKQFNGTAAVRIRALAGNGKPGSLEATMAAIEREADVMPPTSLYNEISKHVKDEGMKAMEAIPMGRRSGKKGKDEKAVLAYLQEKPNRRMHLVECDLATGRATVMGSEAEFEALRELACGPDEQLHLPMDGEEHQESFDLLLKLDGEARDSIKRDLDRVVLDKARIKGERTKRIERTVTDINKVVIGVVSDGTLDKGIGESVMRVIRSKNIPVWEDRLIRLLSEYKQSGDACALMSGVLRIGDTMGMDGDPAPDPHNEPADAIIRLVGAMFITRDDVGRLTSRPA